MNITCDKCSNSVDIEKNVKCPYCNNSFQNNKTYLELKKDENFDENINHSNSLIKKNTKVTKTTTTLKLGDHVDVNEICNIIQNEGVDAAMQRIKEIDPNVKIDTKVNKETTIDEDPFLFINKNRIKTSNKKLFIILILIVSLLILSKIFIV